jgi:hypothetical protein
MIRDQPPLNGLAQQKAMSRERLPLRLEAGDVFVSALQHLRLNRHAR